ncbi:MAG: tetratricopeptide repeat protein [Bacteroidia bacterium]|nr:tetratricopeptide repeat protein [Bacteroidia bacterium]
MKRKDNIRFLLLSVVCITLIFGCSTKKNTPATRAYHELTTRYNIYFNAEESYKQTLQSLIDNQQDNYHDLLPMYPNSSNLNDTVAKQLGGPFDGVVEKMTKAIQEHSITVKPRRDPSQPNTQEYRDWLRQNEFNPFIDRAWLLMGKAHVQNKDYAEAVSVFSQTARLFNYDIDVVSEAQIWMMRAYTEMNWFSDAQTMASTLQARSLPKDLKALFAEFYTSLLLREGNYRDAIPYLAQTVDNQRSGVQKRRLQFLLGQLYTNLGEQENAYRAFERLQKLNTPYEVTFNAIMAQSQVTGSDSKIIDDLQKMVRSAKNKDYLDQIYGAIGNIYFSQNNIEKAIENYLLAEKKGARNGIDKALAQVALGDIYFDKKEFVKAEPRYSEALVALPKNNEKYPQVEFRAEVLGELAPHLSAVAEQDSLQHLAQLPRIEQLKIINVHITELRKREYGKERDAYLSEQQARGIGVEKQSPSVAEAAVALANRGVEGKFYFYNPQLVSQGKSEFRRRWGSRSLQDNWRSQSSTGLTENMLSPDSAHTESPSRPLAPSSSLDPYTAEFYLQQLPVSPEAKAESDKIIENGLFEGGKVAKDRLEDFDFATKLFERHLNDFPESEYRKDIYYQLYLMNLQAGNRSAAQGYKSKIISEFPESENAVSMSDPSYERVMRNFAQQQDSLYQRTYQAYQQGRAEEVHQNYEQALKLFSNGGLMPKFRLLHSLSFAQKGDIENLETSLKDLLAKHPDSEESKLGQSILDGLSEGRILATNASAVSGINWQASKKPEIASDSLFFVSKKNIAHSYLLLFPTHTVKKNELLFAVSDFNFSNFQIRTFNTAYTRISPYEALQIKPFRSFDEADRYAAMIAADSVFRQNISSDIVPLVISDENLELLNTGKSIAEYIAFYNTVLNKTTTDSVQVIVPIKRPETVTELEKVVPLEPEKIDKPIVIPQQQAPKQPEQLTIEQRQIELEQKAEEALKQTDNVLSKKDRERILKEREQARKELIKQRERELKQKEKARKEELKQRERERKQKLKEQEQLRKEKLKERERILRERNR